jgi:DNA adenine methylase
MQFLSKDINVKIKSPLRYPGGKSKAIKQILPLVPMDIEEIREPLVGGGSVFITLKQIFPEKKFWINDLNKDLYSFWRVASKNLNKLVKEIKNIYKKEKDGRKLHKYYRDENIQFDEFERAVRFFILNRITFSGTADSGGYSQSAYEKRFTESSIERLSNLKSVISNIKVSNLDYEDIVKTPGKNVFIFLDPPYYSVMKSKLYGKNGDLHTGFDHERFAKVMKNTKHKWLITYDDCPEIRELFKFANIATWELQYGMNNYKKKTAAKGKELFITNYKLPNPKNDETQLHLL